MHPVSIAPGDGGDADHVLAAIEKTGIDKHRARSLRAGVDHQPVHFAQPLATGSKNRYAKFNLHSGSSRIVARDVRLTCNACYPAPARLWHVGCMVAYQLRTAGT